MQREFLESMLTDEAVIDAILREHGRIVDQQAFGHSLRRAVEQAGGRNYTAIRALLDEQALQNAENRDEAIARAVGQVRKDSPYLFSQVRQPYAAGASAPVVKEFTAEDVSAMSMAEYKRWRAGSL